MLNLFQHLISFPFRHPVCRWRHHAGLVSASHPHTTARLRASCRTVMLNLFQHLIPFPSSGMPLAASRRTRLCIPSTHHRPPPPVMLNLFQHLISTSCRHADLFSAHSTTAIPPMKEILEQVQDDGHKTYRHSVSRTDTSFLTHQAAPPPTSTTARLRASC